MARGYELLVIAEPDMPDDDLNQLIDKVKDVIEGAKGEFLKARKWGKRKLFYRIKGLIKGYFVLVYFNADAEALRKLDALLRYNERVLRYQTVTLDKGFDVQAVPEDVIEQAQDSREDEAPAGAEAEEQAAEEATEEASTL